MTDKERYPDKRTDEDNRRIYEDIYSQSPRYGTASPGRIELMQTGCVPRIPKGCSLLDVGGGTDDFVKRLLDSVRVARGVVFDIAQAAVDFQIARGIEAIRGSINDMPFDTDEFDCIVSFDVLEHLEPEDIDGAIAELCRVAKSIVILTASPVPCVYLGYELHRIIKPHEWWADKLTTFGNLTFDFYDGVPKHHMYYLELTKE